MQCQREVARFATSTPHVDELRRRAVGAAIVRLRAGDFDGALREMYDGLANQAPLTFKSPAAAR